MNNVIVTTSDSGFGADVSGVDLKNLSNEEFAAIHAAWLEAGVIRLRNQPLSDDELQAFSARFGPLEQMPTGRMSEEKKKQLKNLYVTPLSNIIVDGRPIGGLGNSEACWHSDMTYNEIPPPASVLLAVEVPSVGGDTHFADQAAAHDLLPETLRTRISALTIKHDAAHNSIGELRPGFEAFDDPFDAPGAVHPIIREHEETGRPCLYLGRREFACIPGLARDESEALLDELWTYAAQEQNLWHQRWQPADVIAWDNRRVLHQRDDFAQTERRMMRRCQVLSPQATTS